MQSPTSREPHAGSTTWASGARCNLDRHGNKASNGRQEIDALRSMFQSSPCECVCLEFAQHFHPHFSMESQARCAVPTQHTQSLTSEITTEALIKCMALLPVSNALNVKSITKKTSNQQNLVKPISFKDVMWGKWRATVATIASFLNKQEAGALHRQCREFSNH